MKEIEKLEHLVQKMSFLAQKATQGPWWIDSHGHEVVNPETLQTVFIADSRMGPATRHPETGNLSHWPNDWDASYIVGVSPDKILELLQLVSEVVKENKSLREKVQSFESMGIAPPCVYCGIGHGLHKDTCYYGKPPSVEE